MATKYSQKLMKKELEEKDYLRQLQSDSKNKQRERYLNHNHVFSEKNREQVCVFCHLRKEDLHLYAKEHTHIYTEKAGKRVCACCGEREPAKLSVVGN